MAPLPTKSRANTRSPASRRHFNPPRERSPSRSLLCRRGCHGAFFCFLRLRNSTNSKTSEEVNYKGRAASTRILQFDTAASLVMTDRTKKNQSNTMPPMIRLLSRDRLDFSRSILVRNVRFSARSRWFELRSGARDGGLDRPAGVRSPAARSTLCRFG